MTSAHERLTQVREALLRARILLPRADPTTVRGEISRAVVDALDALTDVVEGLVKERNIYVRAAEEKILTGYQTEPTKSHLPFSGEGT